MAGAFVWAVNDGEKIYKNDFNNSNRAGNSAWDGGKITLFSGRNETVAFQAVVENGGRMLKGLSVSLKNLEPMQTEIFKEHYLYIPHDKITPLAWFFAEGGRPRKYGWTPDALIPIEACGGVDICPGETQAFWFDIYVPPDVNAGLYKGAVEITSPDGVLAALPLELLVMDITLTDDLRRKNMVFMSGLEDYYPERTDAVTDDFHKMARAHGFDIVGVAAHSKPFCEETLESYYAKFMRDGDNLFTPKYGYDRWGRGRGARVFPIGMYGADVMGDSDDQLLAEAAKWSRWFAGKNWPGTRFWYICDEPKADQYDFVKSRSGVLKRNNVDLPVFTTAAFKPELEGYIDHWSDGYGVNLADREKHPGNEFSFYNGYSPCTPMVVLDGSAVEFRVNQWLKERYNVDLYFYWESAHWRHNRRPPRGGGAQNVWQDPITFIAYGTEEEGEYISGEYRLSFGNGDGTFFYPGREPFFPENSLGFDGPITSIRMKNLRRGAQDAAYIQMANDAGLRGPVAELIRKATPAGMSEANRNQPPAWSSSGSDWDSYRLELMRLLL
ncbi:MAG: DUF4091 domain-containing protein [Defluviitaleaceae bacterium]|nr:DUF4091 domain-containing protein [Defluviitaleaceae bacterium]